MLSSIPNTFLYTPFVSHTLGEFLPTPWNKEAIPPNPGLMEHLESFTMRKYKYKPNVKSVLVRKSGELVLHPSIVRYREQRARKRRHQAKVRRILKSLLPVFGGDIESVQQWVNEKYFPQYGKTAAELLKNKKYKAVEKYIRCNMLPKIGDFK